MAQVSPQAKTVLLLLFTCLVAACAVGASTTFTVNGASVDSAYTCPVGANDAPYDLHGTVDVRNSTSSSVTIKSVAAVITLVAVHGSWLERVGDKYDAGTVSFSPSSVAAGSSTALKVTVPSACTNGKGPSTVTSYGEYAVALTITTSSGTYKIESTNHHRIIPA